MAKIWMPRDLENIAIFVKLQQAIDDQARHLVLTNDTELNAD